MRNPLRFSPTCIAPPPSTARAFVVEFVIPGPETLHFAKLFDVHMICVVSGRERTEEDYAALSAKADGTT
jgi:hypothetical protein